jgi:hypothetical protein
MKEIGHSGGPGVDGMIILRWIFQEVGGGEWNRSSWLRIGTFGGICECGNEFWGSIKYG